MTTIDPPATVTPEDLLAMPDAVNYELVDGRLVERTMGLQSSRIGWRIGGLLFKFLETHPIGEAFGPDAGYQCFPDAPNKVRKPDLSFIRDGRLAADGVPRGHCPISPDLAVEVISPGDEAYDVDDKIDEYLAVDVRLVWVVWPESRTVMVYRQPSSPLGTVSRLTTADTISGEDVLPGFSCSVKEFFG